jgi:hypothetical protein
MWRRSALWVAAAVVAIVVLATRLEMSFDLSAFFPQQTTLAHDVLIEQIRSGPGSRLLIMGISGATDDELAEASDQLKQILSVDPAFVTVLNGEFEEDTIQTPEPINSYYLLMRDVDYSRNSLQATLQSRLQDLAFGGGAALLDLIARDPFLVTLDVLERLSPVDMSGDMWFAVDGSAVLMAETRAASIDISAQANAVGVIKQAVAALPAETSLAVDITGVGAFSVELQKTIRAEATKRSILASAALILVLLVVFRSPRLWHHAGIRVYPARDRRRLPAAPLQPCTARLRPFGDTAYLAHIEARCNQHSDRVFGAGIFGLSGTCAVGPVHRRRRSCRGTGNTNLAAAAPQQTALAGRSRVGPAASTRASISGRLHRPDRGIAGSQSNSRHRAVGR